MSKLSLRRGERWDTLDRNSVCGDFREREREREPNGEREGMDANMGEEDILQARKWNKNRKQKW